VRHGAAERPCLGAFRIDVDPLAVLRGIGKLIDPLLINGKPVTDDNFLPCTSKQLFWVVKISDEYERISHRDMQDAPSCGIILYLHDPVCSYLMVI
jgi:hypothetical protein